MAKSKVKAVFQGSELKFAVCGQTFSSAQEANAFQQSADQPRPAPYSWLISVGSDGREYA